MSMISKKKLVSLSLAGALPVAALAFAAGVFNARTASSQASSAMPLNIAIANPAKIATELNETKDLQSAWDVDTKQLQQQQSDKETALKITGQKLQYLRQGTKDYADQEQAYLSQSIAYDSWVKENQMALMRRQKSQLKQLFSEIEEASKQVAATRGITLVIADQHPDIPDNLEQIRDADTLRAMISQRTVLYSDPSRDLSSDIIGLLNKQYSQKNQH